MNNIARPIYSDRIKPFIGKGIIKVLTGQRRVGKSYILMYLMAEIKASNPDANIVYINLEYEDFRSLRTEEDLFFYLKH